MYSRETTSARACRHTTISVLSLLPPHEAFAHRSLLPLSLGGVLAGHCKGFYRVESKEGFVSSRRSYLAAAGRVPLWFFRGFLAESAESWDSLQLATGEDFWLNDLPPSRSKGMLKETTRRRLSITVHSGWT